MSVVTVPGFCVWSLAVALKRMSAPAANCNSNFSSSGAASSSSSSALACGGVAGKLLPFAPVDNATARTRVCDTRRPCT